MGLRLLLCLACLGLPVTAVAQPGPSGNQPANALPVRCVNTAGTAFESCGGSGGAGADVNITGVGGNAVTTTVPVSGTITFSNTSLAVTNAGTFAVQCTSGCSAGTPGQTTMANSSPVVIASDQSTLPVSLASVPSHNVTNAGTFAVQATLAAETTKVIGTVNQGTSPWTVNLITGFALAATQTDRSQFTKLTDGTRDGTVKAASTLPLLTDTAVVTTQRDPLPAGTNNIGDVDVLTLPSVTIGTFPDNEPINVAQMSGTAVSMNTGVRDAGTQRVTVATNDAVPVTQATAANLNAAVVGTGTAGAPAGNILTVQGVASMTKLLVTPDSIALPANQSVNVAQVAGTNTVTGGVAGIIAVGGNVANAVAATANPVPVGGIFTTTPATLTTGQTATLQFTAAQNAKYDLTTVAAAVVSTAASGVQKVGIVGNAGAAFDAGNNAAAPANVGVIGLETITTGTSPTAATTGNVRRQLSTTEGVAFTREGSSFPFSCFVALTATATTQCQAAPGAGLKAYVTSVTLSNGAATVQGVDVVYGTGAACVTGITAITHKFQMGTNALTTSPFIVEAQFPTPLVPAAAAAICLRPTAATAFGGTVTGFIAP